MKVIQVLTHFLPSDKGGTEVYTWKLCKELEAFGIENEILIPNYGSENTDIYQFDNLKVVRFAEPSTLDRELIHGKKKPIGILEFEKYIANSRPDIVHFHEIAGSNGITSDYLSIARNLKAKVVTTFHLSGYTCRTGNLLYKNKIFCDGKISIIKCTNCYLSVRGYSNISKFLTPVSVLLKYVNIDTSKWNNKIGTAMATAFYVNQLKNNFELLIERSDRVVAITKWYMKVLEINGANSSKLSFIPQGYPGNVTTKPERNLNLSVAPFKLIFLGRISELKRLHILINVVLKMPANSFCLDIFGQSEDTDYEEKLRKKTIGNSAVCWKGRLEHREVLKTMQQYDALCLCSVTEMAPLVILEAFVAGIPVIASNIAGIAEQVTNNVNGLLFNVDSELSLQTVLSRCITEPSLLQTLKGNLPEVNSFKNVSLQYYQLYKSILNTPLINI